MGGQDRKGKEYGPSIFDRAGTLKFVDIIYDDFSYH